MEQREVDLPRSFPFSSLSSSSRTSSDHKGSQNVTPGRWSIWAVGILIQRLDPLAPDGCALPECSSLTREDTVLVMESAATRRSFLKFLLEPENKKRDKNKRKEFTPPIRPRKQL